MTIISNKIQCNECGDIIESTYRQDFVWCKCKSCAVDGGKAYLKRNYKTEGCYTELSEVVEDAIETPEEKKES